MLLPALVALDLKTGGIRAMRQPGSAFKPSVYAAALEKGMSYNDRILDIPISIPDPDTGLPWTPTIGRITDRSP